MTTCPHPLLPLCPPTSCSSLILFRFVSAGTGTTPTSNLTPTASSTSLETQSTVIISFKSSQTPVQSQATFAEQQEIKAADEAEDDAGPLPPPPGYGTPTNSLASSNVLKKVASFSVDRSSTGTCSSSSSSNAQSQAVCEEREKEREREREREREKQEALEQTMTLAAGAGAGTGAGSRRGSSFVPEKLSFAAYEKFEGKSPEIFFLPTSVKRSEQLKRREGKRGRGRGRERLPGLNTIRSVRFLRISVCLLSFNLANWRHV